MMPFTVISSKVAEAELALLWLFAKDRQRISFAQNLIDRELAKNPHGAGIELSEGLWLIRASPLKAYYEINDKDRVVRITGIKQIV